MLTYPKSTKRVRRMPMHLSSGDVTLMPGKFSSLFTPPPNFPQSDLGRRADSRWALLQISSFLFNCAAISLMVNKDVGVYYIIHRSNCTNLYAHCWFDRYDV